MRPGLFQRVLEYGAAALLAAISLLTTAQIVFRYLLEAPLDWSEELARFLFIWLSFIGAAVCFRRGGHFRLGFLTGVVGAALARQLRLAADLLVLLFALVLTYQGAAILPYAFLSRYVVLGISTGWSYLAIPVAGCLMLVYALDDLRREWRRRP